MREREATNLSSPSVHKHFRKHENCLLNGFADLFIILCAHCTCVSYFACRRFHDYSLAYTVINQCNGIYVRTSSATETEK